MKTYVFKISDLITYIFNMDYNDTSIFSVAFSKLLIEVRQNALVTQTQLSKGSGLTRQSISLMESGKRVPTFKSFCLLAQGLGISPVDLMLRFVRICEEEALARHEKVEKTSMAMDYIVNTRGNPFPEDISV